jgi:HD-GYP domain-containing protein (c-di-GMP phosphodiesterase class II)
MSLSSTAAAAEFSNARGEVAHVLYATVPIDKRTLATHLLVRSLINTCADAARRGQTPDLQSWVNEVLAKPGREVAAGAAIEAAQRAGAYLVAQGLPRNVFTQLQSIAWPHPASRSFEADDALYTLHLDEIEAAIAELLASLDPHSAEHARSVSAWCARLARRLAFSEPEITFITRCGLVHDFHDTVLSENERLAPFMPVVRACHETYDGGVTPDGLHGVDGMAFRIVEVAHAFSESISGNGARSQLSPPAAVEELARAGRYDALVVAALRELLKR